MERNAQGTTSKQVYHNTMTMTLGIVILPMKQRIVSICWRLSCHIRICDIHNNNFNKIEWNSGYMLKWLSMNDGRCYVTKWNISTYNRSLAYCTLLDVLWQMCHAWITYGMLRSTILLISKSYEAKDGQQETPHSACL